MKKIIFFLVLIVACYGCKKDDNEISGTFSGEKIVHYFGTNYDFVDTITIKFKSIEYSYLGITSTHPPDCGSGNYIIKDNSIEFNDELVRTCNLTWDWILSGMYNFRIIDDSITLNQNKPGLQISCRLKKITK
jgi:hypothetical protein